MKCLWIPLLLLLGLSARAQVNYSLKVEFAHLQFLNRSVYVDAQPGWPGYYLDSRPNGLNINCTNGLNLSPRLFTGLGLGYLNFEGIQGINAFAEGQYRTGTAKVSAQVNLKLGYSHIWNQYAGGTGTFLTELGLGPSFQVKSFHLYLQSGILLTQQAFFLPLRIGIQL